MTTEERLARLETAVLKFADGINSPWADPRIRAHAKTLAAAISEVQGTPR